MDSVPDELDKRNTLAALEETTRLRRRAETDDLLLVLRWCDMHAAQPAELRGGPGGERLDDLGGDGTPGVQELSLCELGIARGVHTLAARAVVADALDLRHRLPHVWSRVRELDAEVWVARKIAALTRHLTLEAAGVVDRAVADAIAGQALSRVLELCASRIIEADQAAHQARVEAELRKRYVGLSRTDEHGLRHRHRAGHRGRCALGRRDARAGRRHPGRRPGPPGPVA